MIRPLDAWHTHLDGCPVRIRLRFYDIAVDLFVSEFDRETAHWFYGAHARDDDRGDGEIEAFVSAAGGFFASLLARDSTEKIVGMRERGTQPVVFTFTGWSAAPSVVPPFRASRFLSSKLALPGTALRSPAGRVVLITGANYIGKTSLALRLLDSGWTFISDNVVVIDRESGRAIPYYATFGFRRDTLARWEHRLAGLDTRTVISPDTGPVRLVRVVDLYPGQLDAGGRIEAVVRLVAPDKQPDKQQGNRIRPTAVPAFPAAARLALADLLPATLLEIPVGSHADLDHLARNLDTLVS